MQAARRGQTRVLQINLKKLQIKCNSCGEIHERDLKHYNTMIKKYVELFNDHCNGCWISILNNRPEYKANMKKSLQKLYNSDRGIEVKNKISKRLIEIGHNAGEKNVMKRPEIQSKVSKTRTEMMKNPDEILKYKRGTARAWAEGKFNNIDISGTCKWYDYKHSNGEIYKVQGRYELAFIEWLDKNNMEFLCHRGRIPYIRDGVEKGYYPDFYIYIWKSYVDTKADYWFNKDPEKFDIIRDQNKNLNIIILNKKKLERLGVF
jgi:hypothetical protein